MKYLSWKYRRRRTAQQQREFCAAQSRRVMARWERVHRARPARADDRLLERLTLERPGEMRQAVEVWTIDAGDGQTRTRVTIDGEPSSNLRSLSGALNAMKRQSRFRKRK